MLSVILTTMHSQRDTGHEISDQPDTPIKSLFESPSFELASTTLWRDARKKKALDLLQENEPKVFIDCDEEQCHKQVRLTQSTSPDAFVMAFVATMI